ncbi:MAG: hypothetical protein U9P50_02880, partial [Patescibacteria group bacterium]|nr:hypothetical protein [Patescibacteria group bacterium]
VSPTATITYTMTVTGANGRTGTCSTTVTVTALPPNPPVPTCSMTANPTSIQTGSSSNIAWTASDATSAVINQGVGSVSPISGSRTVSPTTTTTYTGTFTNTAGGVTCSVTVTVSATPPTPSCTLTASPSSIQTGSSSDIAWTASDATSAVINQGVGSVSPISGSRTVSPTATITYTMTVTGTGGTGTCSATIAVSSTPPSNNPTCSLTVNPNAVVRGNSATLSWTSTNVTSVIIDNGVGSVSPNDSISVTPNDATTYTGNFTGPNGTVNCSISISVSTSGCVGSCGGGGSNPPTVNLASSYLPQEPTSTFIYLNQVPYTGLKGEEVVIKQIFFMAN